MRAMKLFILIWNVCGHKNYLLDLHNIIHGIEADIICIALQETHNFMVPWIIQKFFISMFFKSYYYMKIERFCGLVTVILSNHSFHTIRIFVPLSPFYFNKGAIITNVIINKMSILVINLHLEHGCRNHCRRVKQMKKIINAINGQYNYIFICGDFNSRVDIGYVLSSFDELQLIKNNTHNCKYVDDKLDTIIDEFKKADQMRLFRKIFNFEESAIDFLPTYKYCVNTNRYNLKRTPSWCDRILYRSVGNLCCNYYKSVNTVTSSDHKPVISLFEIEETTNHKETYQIDQSMQITMYLGYLIHFVYNNVFFLVIIFVIFFSIDLK